MWHSRVSPVEEESVRFRLNVNVCWAVGRVHACLSAELKYVKIASNLLLFHKYERETLQSPLHRLICSL